MRGSSNYQSGAIIAAVSGYGESKYDAKIDGQSVSVHSVTSIREYREVMTNVIDHAKSLGIRDAEKLTAEAVESYLKSRDEVVAPATMAQEKAAIRAMENGLNSISFTKGTGNQYDFSCRNDFKGNAERGAEWRTSGEGRGYPQAEKITEAVKNETHQLQAEIIRESGCRAEGTGSVRAGSPKNPITADSLKGLTRDPVTGQSVGSFTTIEKGGKETLHYINRETYARMEHHIKENGKIESVYRSFAHSVQEAAKVAGQYVEGRGNHGLRYSWSQGRYLQCVKNGFTHDEARQQVSTEMGHNRLSITDKYLRG